MLLGLPQINAGFQILGAPPGSDPYVYKALRCEDHGMIVFFFSSVGAWRGAGAWAGESNEEESQ